MSKKSWQGKSIRTTITIHRSLYKDLRELMNRHGYGANFSAFICEAARNQKEKLIRREKGLNND